MLDEGLRGRLRDGAIGNGLRDARGTLLSTVLATVSPAFGMALVGIRRFALSYGDKRAHIRAAGDLTVPAALVAARIAAATGGGLGALSGSGRTVHLACGQGSDRGSCRALLLSLSTARPLRSPRFSRNSRPGNGRLFAAVGVVHVTAYGAAQSLEAASRRSLDLRWVDITSARPVRQILFVTPRRQPGRSCARQRAPIVHAPTARTRFSRKNHLHLAIFCL